MGRSRGGLTTKIHAVVEARGLPIRLGLTPGQAYDGEAAMELLNALPEAAMVLADKAYQPVDEVGTGRKRPGLIP